MLKQTILSLMLVAAGTTAPAATAERPSAALVMSEQLSPQAEIIERIDFEGGSLLDLIGKIRERPETQDANLVLRGDAAELDIEPFSLRSVTLESLMKFVVPNGTTYTTDDDGTTTELSTSYRIIHPNGEAVQAGARPIHVFTAEFREIDARTGIAARRELTILPLFSLEEDDGLSVFLDLAMQTFELLGGPEAEFSFHEPSSMLIVRSTEAQRNVLLDLHALFEDQLDEIEIREEEEIDFEEHLDHLSERRTEIELELEHFQLTLLETLEQAEAFGGTTSDRQAKRRVMLEARRLEAVIEQLTEELDDITDEIADLSEAEFDDDDEFEDEEDFEDEEESD